MKCHTNLKAGGGLSVGAIRIIASVIDAATDEPQDARNPENDGLTTWVVQGTPSPKVEPRKPVPLA